VPASANIIRDNRMPELISVLQTNEELGMTTFEKSAKKMLAAGVISKETYEMVKREK
jgi:Tfp pilus assembly pilus retraction ATPase PilT